MINSFTLQEIEKRSPLRASAPLDMLYYSNLHNKAGLEMGFPGVGTFKYLNEAEKDRSKKNYKDFEYVINDIGFRGTYPTTNKKRIMGFFGCSMTFGEGLPEEDNFPYQLSKHYSRDWLNLGMCGAGAQRIALIFQAATQIWDIETAVITLPNYGRFHYIDKENTMLSIIPPHRHSSTEGEAVRQSLVKHFSDQYLMSATKDAASFIVSIAREKNIKLILGSWDYETREILKIGLNYNPAIFTYDHRIESARDNCHPGPIACSAYTNEIKDYIDTNKYV